MVHPPLPPSFIINTLRISNYESVVMAVKDKLQVSQYEWKMAQGYFFNHPGLNKWSRKQSGLTHSFMKINGQVYALGLHHDYLGDPGSFGKAKIAQDAQGYDYALKIEGA